MCTNIQTFLAFKNSINNMHEKSFREVHYTHIHDKMCKYEQDNDIWHSHGLIGAVFCLEKAQSKESPGLEWQHKYYPTYEAGQVKRCLRKLWCWAWRRVIWAREILHLHVACVSTVYIVMLAITYIVIFSKINNFDQIRINRKMFIDRLN